jgi:hypothetical protein
MGYTPAKGKELSELYIVCISEWSDDGYSLGSDWLGLEVSAYFYGEGRRKKGGLQSSLPKTGARAYDIPFLGLIDRRAKAGVAFYRGWVEGVQGESQTTPFKSWCLWL